MQALQRCTKAPQKLGCQFHYWLETELQRLMRTILSEWRLRFLSVLLCFAYTSHYVSSSYGFPVSLCKRPRTLKIGSELLGYLCSLPWWQCRTAGACEHLHTETSYSLTAIYWPNQQYNLTKLETLAFSYQFEMHMFVLIFVQSSLDTNSHGVGLQICGMMNPGQSLSPSNCPLSEILNKSQTAACHSSESSHSKSPVLVLSHFRLLRALYWFHAHRGFCRFGQITEPNGATHASGASMSSPGLNCCNRKQSMWFWKGYAEVLFSERSENKGCEGSWWKGPNFNGLGTGCCRVALAFGG